MLVLLTTLAIVKLSIAITSTSPSYEWFDPLIDVRGVLVDRHVKVPNEEEMQKAAIIAMIESLEDPYAMFVPDEKEKAFIKDLEGDYAGIGAEVRMIDGELVIITPMDDSPALKAGVRAGDVVESIDGELAIDSTIQDLIDQLTGPVGTDVQIDVRHNDETKEEITITRGHIQSPSIAGLIRRNQKWSWCLDEENSIAYIRIRQFNETTPNELAIALQDAEREGLLDGLVIDLRDNPGGALSAAITISNMFLDSGNIVTVSGRANPKRSWDAQPDHILHNVPILIIVNGNSASASEIVAGSLQANKRVAILGTRTFGKGSVQEVLELPSGGMLKFTTARYDLANGRTIDKRLSEDKSLWGVDPNEGLVILESPEEFRDRIESREPYIVITDDEPEEGACGNVEWIKNTFNDHQLSQALLAIQTKLETDQWPILTDTDPVIEGIREEVTELAKERIEILKTLIDVDKQLTSLQTELDEEDASIFPEDVNLKNVRMTITDADGIALGTWRVKNGDVEAALDSLQLEPELQTDE
jgi:carboxyl-terminal processing protease|tara:strand:+ start:5072 stop:6664 length:1593 start_codon:yes stop_codon:yes gene_type:complete